MATSASENENFFICIIDFLFEKWSSRHLLNLPTVREVVQVAAVLRGVSKHIKTWIDDKWIRRRPFGCYMRSSDTVRAVGLRCTRVGLVAGGIALDNLDYPPSRPRVSYPHWTLNVFRPSSPSTNVDFLFSGADAVKPVSLGGLDSHSQGNAVAVIDGRILSFGDSGDCSLMPYGDTNAAARVVRLLKNDMWRECGPDVLAEATERVLLRNTLPVVVPPFSTVVRLATDELVAVAPDGAVSTIRLAADRFVVTPLSWTEACPVASPLPFPVVSCDGSWLVLSLDRQSASLCEVADRKIHGYLQWSCPPGMQIVALHLVLNDTFFVLLRRTVDDGASTEELILMRIKDGKPEQSISFPSGSSVCGLAVVGCSFWVVAPAVGRVFSFPIDYDGYLLRDGEKVISFPPVTDCREWLLRAVPLY